MLFLYWFSIPRRYLWANLLTFIMRSVTALFLSMTQVEAKRFVVLLTNISTQIIVINSKKNTGHVQAVPGPVAT